MVELYDVGRRELLFYFMCRQCEDTILSFVKIEFLFKMNLY